MYKLIIQHLHCSALALSFLLQRIQALAQQISQRVCRFDPEVQRFVPPLYPWYDCG
jgi:hypothetical protein